MQMLWEIQDPTLYIYLPVWTTLSWTDTQATLLMEADAKESITFARQKAKQPYEIASWVMETVPNRNP